MIPWVKLGTAEVSGGQLRLMQRGREFSIMLGSNELMNSRLSGSEEALATLSCDRIKGHREPSVLVGGLDMGFTLRATLNALGEDSTVTVAELVPTVVTWARGPMAGVFDGCLDDPRVAVVEQDVAHLIETNKAAFDAILLDVDNGPDGLTQETNAALYSVEGLRTAKAALRPKGVLSVWSSGPDRHFTGRLKKAGFTVEEVKVRATGKGRGARHVIWIAVNDQG